MKFIPWVALLIGSFEPMGGQNRIVDPLRSVAEATRNAADCEWNLLGLERSAARSAAGVDIVSIHNCSPIR